MENKKDIAETINQTEHGIKPDGEEVVLSPLDKLMKELRREGLFVNQREFVEQTLNTVESAWKNPIKPVSDKPEYRNPFFESPHIPYLYVKDEYGKPIWNEKLKDFEKVYDITSFNELGWDWYFYQFLKLSYEWTKQHHLPCFTLKTSPNFMLWRDDMFSSMYWPDLYAHLYITMSLITWYDEKEGRFKNLLDEPIAILIGKERRKNVNDPTKDIYQFQSYPDTTATEPSIDSIDSGGLNDFFWYGEEGRKRHLMKTNVIDPANAKVLGCPVKVESHVVSNAKAFFKVFRESTAVDGKSKFDADARETVQTRWFWEDLDFLLRGWKNGKVITALEDLTEDRKKMTLSQVEKSKPRRFYFFQLDSRKSDYLNGGSDDIEDSTTAGEDDGDDGDDSPNKPIYTEDHKFVDNDNDGLDDDDGFADNPLNDDDDNMISDEPVLHRPKDDEGISGGLGSTYHGGLGAVRL